MFKKIKHYLKVYKVLEFNRDVKAEAKATELRILGYQTVKVRSQDYIYIVKYK